MWICPHAGSILIGSGNRKLEILLKPLISMFIYDSETVFPADSGARKFDSKIIAEAAERKKSFPPCAIYVRH